jgi:alcohol dehydrogenase (cytochrome c)
LYYAGPKNRTVSNWRRPTAFDPPTGEAKWKFPLYSSPWAGTLATAGNLVFTGDEDGYLMALQTDTGKLPRRGNTGSRLATSPITYQVDGKQYNHDAIGRHGIDVRTAIRMTKI